MRWLRELVLQLLDEVVLWLETALYAAGCVVLVGLLLWMCYQGFLSRFITLP